MCSYPKGEIFRTSCYIHLIFHFPNQIFSEILNCELRNEFIIYIFDEFLDKIDNGVSYCVIIVTSIFEGCILVVRLVNIDMPSKILVSICIPLTIVPFYVRKMCSRR